MVDQHTRRPRKQDEEVANRKWLPSPLIEEQMQADQGQKLVTSVRPFTSHQWEGKQVWVPGEVPGEISEEVPEEGPEEGGYITGRQHISRIATFYCAEAEWGGGYGPSCFISRIVLEFVNLG